MAHNAKKFTGLVGVAVEPNARAILGDVYRQTLKVLTQMPENAGYRKHTEAITRSRLDIVEKTESHAEIEKAIDCGQVEELIIQAKAELSLAEKMKEAEPWHPLQTPAPPKQWQWPL